VMGSDLPGHGWVRIHRGVGVSHPPFYFTEKGVAP